MKQIIELALEGNQVVAKTPYVLTPDTQIEVKRTNFGNADVVIKNEGIQQDALIFRCVNMLIEPKSMNVVAVPIKYKEGIEKAFDDLKKDYELLKEDYEKVRKTLGILVDNLES